MAYAADPGFSTFANCSDTLLKRAGNDCWPTFVQPPPAVTMSHSTTSSISCPLTSVRTYRPLSFVRRPSRASRPMYSLQDSGATSHAPPAKCPPLSHTWGVLGMYPFSHW